MKQLLLFILTLPGAANFSSAQSLKQLSATEQRWSGGVCCRMGTNYVITLEGKNTTRSFTIDTVWIGDIGHAGSGQENFSIQKSKTERNTKYQLFVSETHDTNNTPDILKIKADNPKIHPPVYKGKACILYTIGGHKKLLPIKDFIQLKAIAYP